MAIIKFGAIVTEGSGSLGGHTIQHSKGGMQLRTKPIPSGQPSAAQSLIRSINPQLQAGWRSLTDAQRKIWNDWPVTHGIMNAKGDHKPLSGHSLWMKYQLQYIFSVLPFQLDPAKAKTGPFGPELIKNGTFESSLYWYNFFPWWNVSGGKLNYDATGSGGDGPTTNLTITAGLKYRIKFTLSNRVIPIKSLLFYSAFPYPFNNYVDFLNGSYSYDLNALSSVSYIKVIGMSTGGVFSLDNLSLKQILS